MFDYLYEWMRNLAFYMVLITAVTHAVPNSDYKKYIRFFTGLVLVLMLASPILHLFGANRDLSDLFRNAEYEEKIREMEESSKYLYDVDAESYLNEAAENRTEDGKIAGEDLQETDEAAENGGTQSNIQVEEIRIGHEKGWKDKDSRSSQN